ncbi:phosphoesterase PA-phosphatase-like protein [Nitritalea halalkaliphila LW7]|uniref:Phosphoesterase PA-phosphatase-like protein n=1 Tax=Nitritalea halalkaliphila LW7 TaxID=1189621 RepID=I5C9S5_9BACT|nr:phosphoesterase PA-phosphatase-like protein [Nitritalea halalkaliphila]EIM78577.1 phosphoesterase PA-phosphatase-like protein [Nitritalea halalkaliphila LW7]
MAQATLGESEARAVLLGVSFGIVLPIFLHNGYKVWRGSYTNFDVSNQQQRRAFYPFVLGLFGVLLVLFFVLGLSPKVLVNTSLFTAMLVVFAGVNVRLKASLHMGACCYFACGIASVYPILGLGLYSAGIGVAWSRLALGLHSRAEVQVGMLVGTVFGLLSLALV